MNRTWKTLAAAIRANKPPARAARGPLEEALWNLPGKLSAACHNDVGTAVLLLHRNDDAPRAQVAGEMVSFFRGVGVEVSREMGGSIGIVSARVPDLLRAAGVGYSELETEEKTWRTLALAVCEAAQAAQSGNLKREARTGRGAFGEALARVPSKLLRTLRCRNQSFVAYEWTDGEPRAAKVGERLEAFFQKSGVSVLRRTGTLAIARVSVHELRVHARSLVQAASTEVRVASETPGTCACGIPAPTICRGCMRYVCRGCSRVPGACAHFLVRLSPTQVDCLRRLPLPPGRIKDRCRKTYLVLQRLGLARADVTGMLNAKLPDSSGAREAGETPPKDLP